MHSQMIRDCCGSETCAGLERKLSRACHDLGRKPGQPVMVWTDGRACFCPCPSGALGTGVLSAPDSALIPIALARNETVLAADRTGRHGEVLLGFVRRRPAERHENMICLRYRASGLDVVQVLPADAPIMQYGGEIIAASRLGLTDELVDINGNSVPISDVVWGTYEGVYFDIATDLSAPDAALSARFLIRDGIMVGDFALQLHHVGLGGFGASPEARVLVGTEEWDRINGTDGRGRTAVAATELPNGTFFPAAFATTDIPDDAVAARRIQQGRAKTKGRAATIEDQSPLHRVEHLIAHVLRLRYPSVNFILDWYSHDEDAYFWQDGADWNLLIAGGLVRSDEAGIPALVRDLIESQFA